MDTVTLLRNLKQILPDHFVPLVLAAWRQDPIIWASLQETSLSETFFTQKKISGNDHLNDWSPGRLALFSLNQPYNYDDPISSISSSYIAEVTNAYPNLISDADNLNLIGAGKIALALATENCETGSWQHLRSEVDQNHAFPWGISLACLIGMVKDPKAMLTEFVSIDPCLLRSRLAIHAILSNPAEPSSRIDTLLTITHGSLSHFQTHPLDLLDFIKILHDLNSELACAFCQNINGKLTSLTRLPDSKPFHQTDIIRETAETLLSLEIVRLAGDSVKEDQYLGKLSAMSNLVAASLHIQVALMKPAEPGTSSGNTDLVSACKKSLDLVQTAQAASIKEPFISGLANALVNNGNPSEAYTLLMNSELSNSDDPYQLFTKLKSANQAGDASLAKQIGDQLTDVLINKKPDSGYIIPQATIDPLQITEYLVKIGMPEEAMLVLEHALSTAPYQEHYLRKLIGIQLAEKQFQKASGNILVLTGLYPEDLALRRELAITYEKYQNWNAALDVWATLIEETHYPGLEDEITDLHALAICSIKAGHSTPAIHASQRALSLKSDDALTLTHLGQAYALQGDYGRGLEYLTQATQIDQSLPEGWLALSELFAKQGQFSQAIDHLQTAIQIIPNNSKLLAGLGEYFLQVGNPTQATTMLKQAVLISPENSDYHFFLGKALIKMGHAPEAQEEFAIAYQADTDNINIAHAYGSTVLNSGNAKAALQPLSTAIHSYMQTNPDTYIDYAHAILDLLQLGDTSVSPSEALEAIEYALKLDPTLLEAKGWRAEALRAVGNATAAYVAYQEALDSQLTTDRFWRERLSYGMGRTACQLERYEIAITSALEAIAISPKKADNYQLIAEAYLNSNLLDDSLRAARTVLNLNLDSLANLAWYADHVICLVAHNNALTIPNLQNQAKQAIHEAENALAQAIQLAPQRVDLSIKLSKLQQLVGDIASAQATIYLIINNEHAAVINLIDCAEQLQSLGDTSGAVQCFERAVTLDQSENSTPSIELLTRLAEAYVSNNDLTSACHTYEQAINIAPQLGDLYYQRTILLLRLGHSDDAFACIETGISLARTDPILPRLYIFASWLYRQNGDLASALGYIQKGWEVNKRISSSTNGKSTFQVEDQLLIADTLRVAMQPVQAYQILKSEPDAIVSSISPPTCDMMQWLALKTELENELGYVSDNQIPNNAMEDTSPNPVSWLAMLARLALNKGTFEQAEKYFRLAWQAQQEEYSSLAKIYGLNRALVRRSMVSLIETAFYLNEWKLAQEIITSLSNIAPNEPYTHYISARFVVMKAEFQQLCDKLEVQKHAPGTIVTSTQDLEALTNAIQDSSDLIQLLEQNISTYELAHPVSRLERLLARGQIALSSHPPKADCLPLLRAALALLKLSTPTLPQTAEEAASVIFGTQLLESWDDEQTALAQVLQITRTYSRNPLVWFHAALVLEAKHPREANSAARGAVQLLPCKKIPFALLAHVLLSRVALINKDISTAQESIEAALAIWPDEPRWHLLAASIHLEGRHQTERRRHLEQAAQLDPTSWIVHLELGKAYLSYNDQANLDQAIHCLEAAVHLDPREVTAWIWLARAQLRANQVDKAATSVNQIIALNPENPDVAVLQAEIALGKKSFQVAHNFAQSAVHAKPEDAKTTLLLAKTLESLNRPDEALQVLESALSVSQDPLLLQYERVKLLHQLKDANAALQVLSDLVKDYPNDAMILASLARSQSDLGDLQAATQTALTALKAGKMSLEPRELANVYYLTGSLLCKSGQLDQAIQYLNDAVGLSPDFLEAYLELGQARKDRREYHQALVAFEQATKINPLDPRPPYLAGLALMEGKDFRRSELMLRQAAKLAPDDVLVRRQLAQVVALNLVHNPRT